MTKMNIAKPKRRTVWDFIKQQPLGFIGLILILIMSIAAIFSPEVAPYHPEDVDFEASPALGGGQPSWDHLLGADAFGRDPEFYAFIRSLSAYEKSMTESNTTIVMSPDSEFFDYMKESSGE